MNRSPEPRTQNPDTQPHGHAGAGAPAVEEGRPASVRPAGTKSARATNRTPEPRAQIPDTKIRDLASRLSRDESGLTTLEKLAVALLLISFLAFLPPARGALGDFYDAVFNDKVEGTEELTTAATAARGVLIVAVSVLAFLGSALLLLYTNLGKRLAFLVAGAAATGWLVIGGTLFIIYAPRGLRPRSFEGLNSFQFRVPAIAMTLGALVLFLMFVVALDKYEKESEES